MNPPFSILQKYKSSAEKIKVFDIIIKLNRENGEKTSKELLRIILKASPDFQKIDDDHIEVKFESLPNISEKAYRVLEKCKEPKYYLDILRDINHELSKVGKGKLATDANLKNQMIGDKRFISIAKSGYWALRSWDAVSTKSITELMELYLHQENEPRSQHDIYEFVASKRPGVSRQSIKTYLYDKPQFIRTGDQQYALSSWGGKSQSKAKMLSGDISAKIKDQAEVIFSKTTQITRSELIREIKDKTAISEATIRKAIKSCKEFVAISTIGRSDIIKCTDLRLPSLSTTKPKILLREKVQGEILEVMRKREGKKIQKIDLYEEVIKKVDCIRPTFYAYLSEMTDVFQYQDKNSYYCEIKIEKDSTIKISYLDLSPLESCKDAVIVENVVKATDKLNEKDVDIGLFELGRIFENVIKTYLLETKKKNQFIVVAEDLKRLASMIDCVERNRQTIPIKFKPHHLTLLREDRNLRAHDSIPSKEERMLILAKAPFLVEMYIEYIMRFSEIS